MAYSWKLRLLDYAQQHNLEQHDTKMGIGIGFTDGNDVCWILPGEVYSTLPCPADGPEPDRDLVAEFEAIDIVRGKVIQAARHHLAENGVKVDRLTNGNWAWEARGGISSSLDVGVPLTLRVQRLRDVREVLVDLWKYSGPSKPPSSKRMARYLGMPLPPTDERSIDVAHEDGDEPIHTLDRVISMMVACDLLQNVDSTEELKRYRDGTRPLGRIEQVLRRFAELVPGREASTDLACDNKICVDYSDGCDEFEINLRSRKLAREVRNKGVEATADGLARSYLDLDRKRTQALNAVWTEAKARRWHHYTPGLSRLAGQPFLYLGGSHQEVLFQDADALTKVLKKSDTVAEALREALDGNPEFAEACVQRLPKVPDTLVAKPSQKRLVPKNVPPLNNDALLIDPTGHRVKDMDMFASLTLAKFLARQRALWSYTDRNCYDPDLDTWCGMNDWLKLAEKSLKGDYTEPVAIQVLIDVEDPRADQECRRHLDEVADDGDAETIDFGILWRYRHEYPELTRKFLISEYDDVPFAEERAELNDPVAIRFLANSHSPLGHEDDEDEFPDMRTLRQKPVPEREAVHQRLLVWARSEHRCSPLDDDPLKLALDLGWRDVGAALEENPWLVPGMVTIDRRMEGYDEPGILMAKDLILTWSRLAPSAFLARLLLTAHNTDLVGLAVESSRRVLVDRPELQQDFEVSCKAYNHWLNDLEPALAIAWTRCRPHL